MKWVKFGVSRHFLENPLRKCPKILHAGVSWAPSELIYSLFIFLILALFWLSETGQLWFPGIFWRTRGGNGLKFCMRMYLNHLQNWLVYGDGLLIFLKFWRYFDLVKRVKFGVSEHFLENAWGKWPEILHAAVLALHFACWCVLSIFSIVTVC